MQSSPSTGKNVTDTCRKRAVSFRISVSEASTKSKATVSEPNISTQKVNTQ